MPSEKRQRQDEARLTKRVELQSASKKQQRNRTLRTFAIIVGVLLAIAVVFSILPGQGQVLGLHREHHELGRRRPGGHRHDGLPPGRGAAKRTITFTSGPKACIDVTKTYTAAIKTSRGDFTVSSMPPAAPKTVNSFVFLARNHYYDGVTFHRIIPGFVVQGGDANGNPPGTGGPGYTVPDELPTQGPPYYAIGSLAMANSGPNTNGSQFFVVTGAQGVSLPASYSRFGKVATGMDVVKAIEATGSSAGHPVVAHHHHLGDDHRGLSTFLRARGLRARRPRGHGGSSPRTGRRKPNLAPPPGRSSHQIEPPSCSMDRRAM